MGRNDCRALHTTPQVRYPYMCYGFLAALELQKVGELEVPVDVIKGLDR